MTYRSQGRQTLWRAVIDQALRDALSKGNSGTAEAERMQARAWLTYPSADLAEVCDLAGVEPDRVRAVAAQQIAEFDAEYDAAPARETTPAPKVLTRIKYDGLNLTIPEWSERTGIQTRTLHYRVRQGWSVEDVFSQPSQSCRRSKGAIQ